MNNNDKLFGDRSMFSAQVASQEQRDMCERYNFTALDFTRKKVLSLLPCLKEREAEIDAMIAAVNEQLVNQLIHFSAEEGIDTLAELIINTLQDNESLSVHDINLWIENYKRIEQEASRKHLQQIRFTEPNIINYLKNGDQRAKTALGDNYDINTILRHVISHTEGEVTGNATKFESNKDYILSPVSLIVSVAEAGLLDPVQIVVERLQTIIAQTKGIGENINIYIPANCSQGHWVLIHFTINGTQVTDASIKDSLGGNRAANSQMKKIISAVNHGNKIKLRKKNLKVQTNGHSCMDFTIQHALQDAKTIQLDSYLRAIRDSQNQIELRNNVIKTLYQNHPDLHAIFKADQERRQVAGMAKVTNDELSKLIANAKNLSEARRLAYFKDHCAAFKYGQLNITPVLACLNSSDQTELVRHVFDTYVNSFGKLEQCLEYLPEEEKFDYLVRKYYVIQNPDQILRLATLVPAERAHEYWSHILPFMTSAAILKRFLAVVPNQDMCDLLIAAYIKRIVTQQELLEFMEALPVNMPIQVLEKYPALRAIDADILSRIKTNKDKNREKSLTEVKANSFAELVDIMKDYNQSECLQILQRLLGRHQFADTNNFAAVLRCVEVDKRWLIVQQCAQYITMDNVRSVKKVLDGKHRNDFIKLHKTKFTCTAAMINELDAAEQYKEAKIHLEQPSGAEVLAALSPKAKLDIATYSKILFELNRYLSFHIKLHDDRVRELQNAVISAESINDVVDLIRSQISLMRFNGKPNPRFSKSNFSFLNHAPGKKLLSIGYKIMLKRCQRVLGSMS